ncbi:hypothetical protein B0A49_10140 [Cryomyces minteri]|uniref:UFSP1/2/DUB catalytic domain-containing protein n=1 Tax=Cryomyces minteri TaxID=331657 RepID=A0A4U0WNX7_9PEZI|nr:hypothetical protein B0A49_10140 [Cryomyces minteri]
MAPEDLHCPFCPFSDPDSYFLALHVEEVHTEDSPFAVRDSPSAASAPSAAPSQDGGDVYVECPEEECGEQVLITDLNEHLDLHLASQVTIEEPQHSYSNMSVTGARHVLKEHHSSTRSPETPPQYTSHTEASPKPKKSLARSIFSVRPKSAVKARVSQKQKELGRLGTAELGPYAWEERMPRWLFQQLQRGADVQVVNRTGRDGALVKHTIIENETPGIVPMLAKLSEHDSSVERAWYCHPSTRHVFKMKHEGGFCGYRNIQMLISFIQGAKAEGHAKFPGGVPGVIDLQDMIEDAWDKGINDIGRFQTGGIRGTRKYIGTPDALALYTSLSIDTDVAVLTDCPGWLQAHEQLLAYVSNYFNQSATAVDQQTQKTLLAPLYLQQPGHSLTIVGFERHRDGSSNVVVLDPSYETSSAMRALLAGKKSSRSLNSGRRNEVMRAYRRGERHLDRHREFEILR